MPVEICRKKKLPRNLRRFWDLVTLHSMILPMPNSFRLFVTARRSHAKSRFRFTTDRKSEPAGSGSRAGRIAGERFFPARSAQLRPRSYRVRTELEFVCRDNR